MPSQLKRNWPFKLQTCVPLTWSWYTSGMLFRASYTQSKTTDVLLGEMTAFVKLTCGSFGEIKRILSFTHEGKDTVLLMLRTIYVTQAFKLPHMHEVTGDSRETVLLPVTAVQTKCICLQTENKMLICTFPNTHERD